MLQSSVLHRADAENCDQELISAAVRLRANAILAAVRWFNWVFSALAATFWLPIFIPWFPQQSDDLATAWIAANIALLFLLPAVAILSCMQIVRLLDPPGLLPHEQTRCSAPGDRSSHQNRPAPADQRCQLLRFVCHHDLDTGCERVSPSCWPSTLLCSRS